MPGRGEHVARARPAVSVVVPFYGDHAQAEAMRARLATLQLEPSDELIVADNTDEGVLAGADGVTVVAAGGEHSPAHARNAGVVRASCEWLLFIDADCRPTPSLLADYFALAVSDDVGALAGGVDGGQGSSLVARYASYRGHLDQAAHFADPYRPRAASANLLVRRAAWEAIGGFSEGARAGEDADFCWRMQEEGWLLELRESAVVLHEHRETLAGLRAQWRGYGAARAWLDRRHPASRVARRPMSGVAERLLKSALFLLCARPQRALWSLLDAVVAAESAIGLVLSNRPGSAPRLPARAVVLVCELAPATFHGVSAVEAASRPRCLGGPHEQLIVYREDDGSLARLAALAKLLLRHPRRVHAAGVRETLPLAPAARRLELAKVRELVAAVGAEQTAARLALLSGAHRR